MFQKIFITFFLFLPPLFTFASTGDIFSGTGDIETTGTGNIIEEDLLDTTFKINFQNPSYILDREIEKAEYICDKEKEECKINFKLTKLDGKDLSSKISCEINFGFVTTQGKKCNPTTVIFPYLEKKVIFKVFEKDNIDNYTEKEIRITNSVGDIDTLPNDSITTGTGGIMITNSGARSEQSNTGSIISLTGRLEQILVPEPIIEIQSGIEYSGAGEIWSCKREDCKINLTAENIFSGAFDKKDYLCQWSFSGGIYSTGTLEKCNPGYVDYGIGIYIINLKVYEKNNLQNYTEKEIIIKNSVVDGGILPDKPTNTGTGGITIINTGSIISLTGTLEETLVPEPIIEVQSGIEYSGTGKIWSCKREDCKINLTAENIFSGAFDKKDYLCQWSFSGGIYSTGTLEKCNPGYVGYLLGEYIIDLKIFEKGNKLNYKKSFIKIENKKIIKKIIYGGVNLQIPKEKEIKIIKDIIIQSGLEIKNGKYICNKDICKVNLKYNKSYKDTCLWNFGGGRAKEKYLYTCNPGIVSFSPGEYKIGLKVFDNIILLGEKKLTFSNIYKSFKQKNNRIPIAKISLQGRLSKGKSFSGNTITCIDLDKCNINLTGAESFDIDKNSLSYKWNFGNGEKSEKINPKGVWYSQGRYTLSLEVNDSFGGKDIKELFVNVIGKKKKIKQLKTTETVEEENFLPIEVPEKKQEAQAKQKFLQITKVLPNPKGVDSNEWIEIKSIGEYKVNLKGLIIDDILEKGSKPYVVKEDIFLEYNQVIRFYKFNTKISLNNLGDEVNLIFNNEIIDSLSWNFSVRDNYILTHKNLEIEKQEVFVERVVDGDTIVIRLKSGDIEKLRLIGVDTPETKDPRKKVEFYGIQASNFTKKYLEGQRVILEIDPENYRDKYGRLLGYIYIKKRSLGNIFFNQFLIDTGNARGYFRFPFKYSNDFKKREYIAKKEKVGLWVNKNIKKIFLKEARIDKKVLEKKIKILKEENNLFIDIDKNNIPDIYEKIVFSTINIELSNKDNKILQDESKKPNKVIKNYESYNDFIQKSFIFKISKLKSGLKITGNTLPNSKVNLSFGDNIYHINSDDKGNFTYFTDNIIEGEYIFHLELTDNLGNTFLINKSKDITLDKEYITVLNNLKQEKVLKDLKKKQKKLKKARKISKKKKVSKKKVRTIEINNFIEEEKIESVIPLFFMKILMFFIFLLSIFLVLRKKGIFDPLDIFKNHYREELLFIID